jgi:hypothetical protein
MLGGSLTFLVSLYLRWMEQTAMPCAHPGSWHCALTFNLGQNYDGWDPFGQIAAVLAFALAGAAIAAMMDRRLASRLPVGKVALALGIFALLSVADLWGFAVAQGGYDGFTTGLGSGGYLGLASAGGVCIAAAAARWSELIRPPSAAAAVGQVITLVLIASFLLPALNVHAPRRTLGASGYQFVFQTGTGVFICAVACLGLAAWSRADRPALRLATAAAIATLVAGYLLPLRSIYARWPYELWLLLACTVALLALSLVGSRGVRFHRPSVYEVATVSPAVLLIVSLFLPWQSPCAQGSCVAQQGWGLRGSALAGTFVLVLLVAVVCLRRFPGELALGTAIYVMSAGLTATEYYPGHLGYGAPLGFAGAACLLYVGLRRLRPLPGKGFLIRLAPAFAALGLLSFEVGAVAGRTTTFEIQSPWLELQLLDAAAILLTLRVLLRWFDRPRDHADVVLLPLGLLALTVLALIYSSTSGFSDAAISWEGWVSVFLCLALAVCGWIERKGGGLERFRVPEAIWRIDRLPGAED